MYGEPENAVPPVDPYSEYTAPAPPSDAPPQPAQDPHPTDTVMTDANRVPPPPALPLSQDRRSSRSRSPGPRYRSPPVRDASYRARSPAFVPPARRAPPAPLAPNPSNVLGIFGLSIRTLERDLEEEFNRFGRVEKVVIVYDQRSDRSRGFGFITMNTVEEATRCIQEMNGVELNGRRIRVDYSVTDRPHTSTPGEYMGYRRAGADDRGPPRRSEYRGDRGDRGGGGRYEGRGHYDRYDRGGDRYSGGGGYRDDRYSRDDRGGGDRGDRDPFGRDWRDRADPAPSSHGRRYSPSPPRRRRSNSPGARSPMPRRDYDSNADGDTAAPRW